MHDTTPTPPGLHAGELLVRAGPGRGIPHPLQLPVTLVGRGAECDIRVRDLTVRPDHCVIARTPAGLHLRSLGGPTVVNGLPTLTRTLADGDVIALGPVELQVRRKPTVPDPDPPPAARKGAPCAAQLARGRAQLLRERSALRADFARHLQALVAGRAEAEDARAAAAAERERLRDLRRRFIRRWNIHWADERARQTAERTFLTAEIDRLTRERDDARRERVVSTEHLDRREAELARREGEQDARRRTLDAELAGLEARIASARTAVPPGPIVAVATPDVPDVPDLTARRDQVEQAAAEIADQYRAQAEHLTGITEIAADVRAGERETADALAEIVADVARLEDAAVTDRARLDARHARLVMREGRVERREVEVSAREQRAELYEETLSHLAARWASLRRAQVARAKADLEQAALMRQRAGSPPVPAEDVALGELFRTTAERLARLVYQEQELTDREIDAARRDADARHWAEARDVEWFRRQAALAVANREVTALRSEVERLATLLDRSAGPVLRVA